MFSRMTSSSVRMAAAMQGSAEFFAPETRMVPRRGFPPRTTNLSIWLVYGDFAWKWVAGVVRIWRKVTRGRRFDCPACGIRARLVGWFVAGPGEESHGDGADAWTSFVRAVRE